MQKISHYLLKPSKDFALSALLLVPVLAGSPQLLAETTWTSQTSSTFSTVTNWSNGLPSDDPATVPIDPHLGIFIDSLTIQHSLDIAGTGRNALGLRFDSYAGGAGFVFTSTSIAGATGFQLRALTSGSTIINNDENEQTFNVPVRMYTTAGASNSNLASQTWSASAGNLTFGGAYGGIALLNPAIDNNGGTLTIDGSFSTTIGTSSGRGDVIGVGGLIKNGLGMLTLGGTVANSFSGNTTVSSGTLNLAKTGALAGTSLVVVNGGTLLLSLAGGNGRIKDGVGTTFGLGGHASAASKLELGNADVTETFGSLSLTLGIGIRVIDFGVNAASGKITFDSISNTSGIGQLQIWNWAGNASGNGGDQLLIATGSLGTSGLGLSDIKFFSGPNGGGSSVSAQWATGNSLELVPVPEVGALFGALGLLAPLAWRERRHWLRCREARA